MKIGYISENTLKIAFWAENGSLRARSKRVRTHSALCSVEISDDAHDQANDERELLFGHHNVRIWRWFILQSFSAWSYLRVDIDIRSIIVHMRELWPKCQNCYIVVRTSRFSTKTAIKSLSELRIHLRFD